MPITISMTAAAGASKTVQDIIEDALEIIGVVPDGSTPTAEQLATGLARYNSMAQSLFVESNNTWLRTSSYFDLVAGTASYNVSEFEATARVVRVLNAFLRNEDDVDTPIVKISKQEYFSISDKNTSGVPTQFWVDERAANKIYVWPLPSASDLPLELHTDYIREYADAQLSDAFSPPPAWIEAATYGLAVRLAMNYGVTVTPELAATAAKALNVAQGQDYEDASIYPVPALRGRR